jgi:uncharacterized Zn finger protein
MVPLGAKLSEEQQKSVVQYLNARTLLIAKCTVCHGIQRTLTKNKSREEWKVTVDRMATKFSNHISAEEAERLVEFLAVDRPPK